MKKLLSIALAAILLFGGVFSASAATQTQKKKVYVASQSVPKAAVEFVRDWFGNHMPAQDICDQTKMTIEQVKEIRVCPAFTVEPFETDTAKRYYFPLMYEDAFVGILAVSWSSWDGGSGYICHLDGGSDDPFIKALNSLSSSASAPLMFVVTKDGYFALDSKNKATLIQTFIPSSEKDLNRQKRAIPKIERPSKTVAISADTAYLEQISSQQLVDESPILSVKNKTQGMIYTSNNGGKKWRTEMPPVYVSIDVTSFLKKNGKVPYTVHNRTGKEISSDVYFTLMKWNGQEWVSCPETDGMDFNDVEIMIEPKSTQTLEAAWAKNGVKLEEGRYKLIKKLYAGKQEYVCEAEFCLV